jgi:hypothetical protein
LFTLDNLGLLDSGDILRAWPLFLIGYGMMRLTGFGARHNLPAGIIFTGIGSWILLHNFGLIDLDPWDLWPVLLILIGVSMVTGSLARARATVNDPQAGATLSAFALMSGTERKVASQEFRGGDVTAIMGGHVIDLRPAKLPEGSAVIDLLVWWGGVDILVPHDWVVSSEALPIMGAVEDNTQAPTGPVSGRLILKGMVVMGGVEVKN